jgi:hypothetical protein
MASSGTTVFEKTFFIDDIIEESLRVMKDGGCILFEFFGDPVYFKDGMIFCYD